MELDLVPVPVPIPRSRWAADSVRHLFLEKTRLPSRRHHELGTGNRNLEPAAFLVWPLDRHDLSANLTARTRRRVNVGVRLSGTDRSQQPCQVAANKLLSICQHEHVIRRDITFDRALLGTWRPGRASGRATAEKDRDTAVRALLADMDVGEKNVRLQACVIQDEMY
jgi:hypothetical protein